MSHFLSKEEYIEFLSRILYYTSQKESVAATFHDYYFNNENNTAAESNLLFDLILPNGSFVLKLGKLSIENSSDSWEIVKFIYDKSEIKEEKIKNFISGSRHKKNKTKLLLIYNGNKEQLPACVWNKNIELWDQKEVNILIREFLMDYEISKMSFRENHPMAGYSSSQQESFEKDFINFNNRNIELLLNYFKRGEKNLSFVLGVGASVDLGARKWEELLEHFNEKLKQSQFMDDPKLLSSFIGSSQIVTAENCKNLFEATKPNSFYWELHNGIYPNKDDIDLPKDTILFEIARIIKKLSKKQTLRVLTYNYDQYLEDYLDSFQVPYKTLYDDVDFLNRDLPIFHVHGFLPRVKSSAYLKERYNRSIYLTEQDYHNLYNDPYSWQISTQLCFYRESHCLFIGCSLVDPNIRRLLKLTKSKSNKMLTPHFAIFKRPNLSYKDLLTAYKFYADMGITTIFVEDHADTPKLLARI
ncbi:MAG TPA: SIR2 family protein [Lachnospiraceae bacterium]